MTSHTRIQARFEIPERPAVTGPQTIAATFHLPEASMLAERPPVMICMPGGGYNRHYFDLPEPGYSQAEHHVARGTIVVAIDHLSVGESSQPPQEEAYLADVAAANNAAVAQIVAKLKEGSVAPAFPAVSPSAIIGVGQSMGCFVLVTMQARHRTFDAIAILGASMVCIRFPMKVAEQELRFSGDSDAWEAVTKIFATTDFRYAFHWEDEPDHLVTADMACKPPLLGQVTSWQSASSPNVANTVLPGVVAREAAAVEVPVLLAMGERDVCQDPLRELAAFHSTRDLSVIVIPRMAHMHNFASTRRRLWKRIDAFVDHVAALSEEG